MLDQLNSPRFADQAVPQVHATLLDEGTYLRSPRTMYRIFDDLGHVSEPRNQLRHPAYAKPELLASVPNQVWSWDVTKLKGRSKWSRYQLYVILDTYSRYVVGWMVKQAVRRDQVTIHADRGTAMTSKDVAILLADLGVTKTHSRPQVSIDNQYSEAHFKTLKYRPELPARFNPIEDGRSFGRVFFEWYNREHRHSGIAMMTPHHVHHGLVDEASRGEPQCLHSHAIGIPNALSAACRSHRDDPDRLGSTSQPTRPHSQRPLTNLQSPVSQNR